MTILMPKNNQTSSERQIAVLTYGSLLAHPGEWLGPKMVQLIRRETPFPVEYAGRADQGCGGTPTLVGLADDDPIRRIIEKHFQMRVGS